MCTGLRGQSPDTCLCLGNRCCSWGLWPSGGSLAGAMAWLLGYHLG